MMRTSSLAAVVALRKTAKKPCVTSTISWPRCPRRSTRKRPKTASRTTITSSCVVTAATVAIATIAIPVMIAAIAVTVACVAVIATTPMMIVAMMIAIIVAIAMTVIAAAKSRRRIWCRWPASSTCSTPTLLCALPATCPARTTCTFPWARSRSTACARAMPCMVRFAPRVKATAATSARSSCRCRPSIPSTAKALKKRSTVRSSPSSRRCTRRSV